MSWSLASPLKAWIRVLLTLSASPQWLNNFHRISAQIITVLFKSNNSPSSCMKQNKTTCNSIWNFFKKKKKDDSGCSVILSLHGPELIPPVLTSLKQGGDCKRLWPEAKQYAGDWWTVTCGKLLLECVLICHIWHLFSACLSMLLNILSFKTLPPPLPWSNPGFPAFQPPDSSLPTYSPFTNSLIRSEYLYWPISTHSLKVCL